MIGCDTSSLSAFLVGDVGADVAAIEAALLANDLVLPPVTLTEALSNPRTRSKVEAVIQNLKLLDLRPDYWRRAAHLRGSLLAKGLKARLADTLIAQSCIDAGVPLITRDKDFRHFAAHGGLKLA